MVFNSISECIAYIESCIEKSMQPLSVEIKQMLDTITREQVRGYTNQIFSSVVAESGGMTASAGFEDTGAWYSLINPSMEVGNPIKFLEASTTWGRSGTSIMSTALGRAESEIPQKFLQLMRSMGIPIEG